MRQTRTTKFFTVGSLLLSGALAHPSFAAEKCEGLFNNVTPVIAAASDINPTLVAALAKKQIQMQLLQYASSVLKGNPLEVVATKKVSPLEIKDLGEIGTVAQEYALLAELAKYNNQGKLRPTVIGLFEQLKAMPELGGKPNPLKTLSPEKQAFLVETVVSSLEGILALRGMTTSSAKVQYTEWPALSNIMTSRLNQSPGGLENILHFAKTKFDSSSKVKLLLNGPESFSLRDTLMTNAKKSIDVLTWAIYSDKTGFEAADLLIKKHLSGVKVRVMVDGQVANRPGYTEAVQKIEQAGIEVIRWTSESHTFQGQHRKMLIIDGEHIIAGGLNFGDVYSHKNPDNTVPRWRDTDVYIQGDAVNEGRRLFADLWNQQIGEKNLNYQMLEIKDQATKFLGEGDSVAILDHNPAKDREGSTIMMTLLKGIREAKQSVDIENAYVVLFPALKNEIQTAVSRGVRVRVLTNSNTSVDEPVVSVPILRSAHQLASVGADVYLKQGTTLHSKLAVIDGQYSMIMSYNLHPRSERMEGEMAVVVKSESFAKTVTAAFIADIQTNKAVRVEKPEDIQLPDSPQVIPVLRLFFDML